MTPADLFPLGHDLSVVDGIVTGYATTAAGRVCVIGTTGGVRVGNAAALRLAGHVLDCVGSAPRVPVVMLVDTAGQAPRRHDELLGLPVYLGHLLACLHLARREGHPLVSVATGAAIAAAFLCYGMFADETDALSGARVGLMPVEAMSEVTKIPVERLTELSETMPALEFGVDAFARLGGVHAVWEPGEAAARLDALLAATPATGDERARLGAERGGRNMAALVQQQVLEAAGAGGAAGGGT